MELGQGNTFEADAVACNEVPGRAGINSDRRTETTPPAVHPPTFGTLSSVSTVVSAEEPEALKEVT